MRGAGQFMWTRVFIWVLGFALLASSPALAQQRRGGTFFESLLGTEPFLNLSKHFTGLYVGSGIESMVRGDYDITLVGTPISGRVSRDAYTEEYIYTLTPLPRVGGWRSAPNRTYDIRTLSPSVVVGWGSTIKLLRKGYIYLAPEFAALVPLTEGTKTLVVDYRGVAANSRPELGNMRVDGASISFRARHEFNGSLLVGYIFNERLLIYGRVGLSFTRQDVTTTITYVGDRYSSGQQRVRRDKGLVLGGGVQWRLSNFMLRVEYVNTTHRGGERINWPSPTGSGRAMLLDRDTESVRAYLLYQF